MRVNAKNIIENIYELILLNNGKILISKVVAPVLGITNMGPRHSIIKTSNTIPNLLLSLPITFCNEPAFATAIIYSNIILIFDNINLNKLITNYYYRLTLYIRNIRLPATKKLRK